MGYLEDAYAKANMGAVPKGWENLDANAFQQKYYGLDQGGGLGKMVGFNQAVAGWDPTNYKGGLSSDIRDWLSVMGAVNSPGMTDTGGISDNQGVPLNPDGSIRGVRATDDFANNRVNFSRNADGTYSVTGKAIDDATGGGGFAGTVRYDAQGNYLGEERKDQKKSWLDKNLTWLVPVAAVAGGLGLAAMGGGAGAVGAGAGAAEGAGLAGGALSGAELEAALAAASTEAAGAYGGAAGMTAAQEAGFAAMGGTGGLGSSTAGGSFGDWLMAKAKNKLINEGVGRVAKGLLGGGQQGQGQGGYGSGMGMSGGYQGAPLIPNMSAKTSAETMQSMYGPMQRDAQAEAFAKRLRGYSDDY